jgi:hypothetical protein
LVSSSPRTMKSTRKYEVMHIYVDFRSQLGRSFQ